MKKLLILLCVGTVALSCKKEVTIPNNGIYRGAFREYSATGDTLASGLCFLAIFESDNTFKMVGDSISNAPADHAGTYLVDNATNMQFTNATPPSTSFDVDHYLDTVYNYSFDDVNFKFWQTRYGKLYEYTLVRN
jgi:hypothetical protein